MDWIFFADKSLTIGIVLVVFYLWRRERRHQRRLLEAYQAGLAIALQAQEHGRQELQALYQKNQEALKAMDNISKDIKKILLVAMIDPDDANDPEMQLLEADKDANWSPH